MTPKRLKVPRLAVTADEEAALRSESARNRGTELEDLLLESARMQDTLGLALRQTSPRFKGRIFPDGRAVGRFVEKGPLDLVGDLKGRAVNLDAKMCRNKTAYPLDKLKDHQVQQVEDAWRRGCVAAFVIGMVELTDDKRQPAPRYFAADWRSLEPYWPRFVMTRGLPAALVRKGEKQSSIPLSDLTDYGASGPGSFVELHPVRPGWPWLDLVRLVRELEARVDGR